MKIEYINLFFKSKIKQERALYSNEMSMGYVYVSKYIEYLNIWQLSQKCKYFYWIFFKKCLL